MKLKKPVQPETVSEERKNMFIKNFFRSYKLMLSSVSDYTRGLCIMQAAAAVMLTFAAQLSLLGGDYNAVEELFTGDTAEIIFESFIYAFRSIFVILSWLILFMVPSVQPSNLKSVSASVMGRFYNRYFLPVYSGLAFLMSAGIQWAAVCITSRFAPEGIFEVYAKMIIMGVIFGAGFALFMLTFTYIPVSGAKGVIIGSIGGLFPITGMFFSGWTARLDISVFEVLAITFVSAVVITVSGMVLAVISDKYGLKKYPLVKLKYNLKA